MPDPVEATSQVPDSPPLDEYPRAEPPKPVFGSSCWGYGLWITGLFLLAKAGGVLQALHEKDFGGAAAFILMPFVLLTLAAMFDISRARRAGKLRIWTWLNLIPAIGVVIFGSVVIIRNQLDVPDRATAWVPVTLPGSDCTALMPGQPTEKPVPEMKSGIVAHMLTYNGKNEGYVLCSMKYPEGSIDDSAIGMLKDAMTSAAGEVRDEQDTHMDTVAARQFTLDSEKLGMTMVYRMCRIGDSIYEVGYSAPLGKADALNAQDFFNSFHFTAKQPGDP